MTIDNNPPDNPLVENVGPTRTENACRMNLTEGSGTRASRRVRKKGRTLRLRGRDLDILLALSKMLLLSTSAITRLFFDSKGTCQKRLRKLFDENLIRAVVIELASENRYTLTRLGYALLEKALPAEPLPPYRIPPRVDRRGLAHLDLLNHTRISMALGAAMHEATLMRFVPDWDLRSIDQRAEIIPDSLIILRGATRDGIQQPRDWSIALEVDCSTESPSVFGRKLSRYHRCAKDGATVFGVKDPLILVVTPTERRARTLAKQARDVQVDHIVFSPAEAISTDGGIMSGLAYVEDLADSNPTPNLLTFSRGLLRPEGVPK